MAENGQIGEIQIYFETNFSSIFSTIFFQKGRAYGIMWELSKSTCSGGKWPENPRIIHLKTSLKG